MNMLQDDRLTIGGHSFTSRFILGSGKYSLELIQAAIEKAGAQMVTLALRHSNCPAGPRAGLRGFYQDRGHS